MAHVRLEIGLRVSVLAVFFGVFVCFGSGGDVSSRVRTASNFALSTCMLYFALVAPHCSGVD